MSVVTNVIITYPVWGPSVDVFNTWLEEAGHGPLLDVGAENLLRSEKTLEATVLVGAFNYLQVEPLVEFLRKISWNQDAGLCGDVRPNVRIGIQEEGDNTFLFFGLPTEAPAE